MIIFVYMLIIEDLLTSQSRTGTDYSKLKENLD